MYRIQFLFLVGFVFQLSAQEVIVSKDMSIRSDYAYEILGPIDDNILLFRDRGIDKFIASFDEDLEFNWEQKLLFEEKRVKVYGLSPQDTLFTIFYGMKKDGIEYLRAANYDKNARLQDSVTIAYEERNLVGQDFQFVNSQNRKKTLLYYIDNSEKFRLFVYDHKLDTLDWQAEYLFDGGNLYVDIADVHMTESGSVVMMLEKDHARSGPKQNGAQIIILEKSNESGYITDIDYGDSSMQSIKMSVDEKNKRIGFFGLYNSKKANWSEGYCYKFIDLRNFADRYVPEYKAFRTELVEDIYGSDAKKKKGLNFFSLSDIIWRQDGGMVVAMEMQRKFSRRSSYDSSPRTTTDFYSSSRGWVDYFNEDIVLTALHPNGEEHWQKILFKKQFSQDDGGIFSSYFPFMTPSRLRLIFNDQIKTNSTVSEYVINGVGKYKRESLFSTEYQNLRLRFVDALQISPTSLLVPSQKNYNLALVKISYQEEG
jgi:hypothetical protein